MKTKEVQKKSSVELSRELGEKRIAMRDIRFGSASGKSKNVKEYGNIRKDIAKINTQLRDMK